MKKGLYFILLISALFCLAENNSIDDIINEATKDSTANLTAENSFIDDIIEAASKTAPISTEENFEKFYKLIDAAEGQITADTNDVLNLYKLLETEFENTIFAEKNEVIVESPTDEIISNAAPGIVAGKVMDHLGRNLINVKVSLFNDATFKEMKTISGGNFAFNVTGSNKYYLSVSYGNEYFYTNIMVLPDTGVFVAVRFVVPITVYGQLFVDGEPCPEGTLIRCIGKTYNEAGGLVMTNGYFRLKNITPGNYVVVLERRKRFIDDRINEGRYYHFNVNLTSTTVRIFVDRDRRNLTGNVLIDSMKKRYVNALIILKDANTDGMLIHREAYTYYRDGYYVFKNLQAGSYKVYAVSGDHTWQSEPVLINVNPQSTKNVKADINVITDPLRKKKELENLKKQFRKQ